MARPYALSRREITLVLFSIMIFLVFYNFEATSDFFTNSNLPGISSNPTVDGGLDMDIYGDWVSDDRRISSVHKQQEKEYASEGDIWLKSERVSEAQKQVIFGNIGVNDGFMHWGQDMPETRIAKHVAGRCAAIAYGRVTNDITYRNPCRVLNHGQCNNVQWHNFHCDGFSFKLPFVGFHCIVCWQLA